MWIRRRINCNKCLTRAAKFKLDMLTSKLLIVIQLVMLILGVCPSQRHISYNLNVSCA